MDPRPTPLNRRSFLAALGSIAAAGSLHARSSSLAASDQSLLEDLVHSGCLFFWEQASTTTGQVLDRARHDLNGARDPRRMASIAATGFGLTALCIADHHGYFPHAQIVERVRNALAWHLNSMPQVHGFFYHFTDLETGSPFPGTELSSIDTALLLCGVLAARAHFSDPQIHSLATQIYQRVDWPWMQNGGQALSMGWHPDSGFLPDRWNHYCELMMIYLLAIGSPSHPIAPQCWASFTRPIVHYKHFAYNSGPDPLFTHQYSHAWFDFRNQRDAYADYFQNSITATRAHKAFCLDHPEWFSNDYWGVSASDVPGGYAAWGGPPAMGPLDGSVVPCATAGSLPFLPHDCLHVLTAMRARYGSKAFTRYGFVDAFHPAADWYDPDVLGIDQGITVLMAENLRTNLVWSTFMRNPECLHAMALAGFHPA